MTEKEVGGKEYIIVSRIDKVTPLTQAIPLHMTVLHWFEFDQHPDVLVEAIRVVGHRQQPLTTRATGEDLFGPERDVPVMCLERTPELVRLHVALVAAIKNSGARLDRQWTGEDTWNPHVTHQQEGRLYSGDLVSVEDLDVIVKRQDGVRQLVARVAFGR